MSNTITPTTSRPCRYYLSGNCKASQCQYSHDGNTDLNIKYQSRTPCRYYLAGCCKAPQCQYSHDTHTTDLHSNGSRPKSGGACYSDSVPDELLPCKYYLAGCCKAYRCQYSHDDKTAELSQQWLNRVPGPIWPDQPPIYFSDSQIHNIKRQPFTHYLVLDLEGKEEIIELPSLAFHIDPNNGPQVISRFHRWVKPVHQMSFGSFAGCQVSHAVEFDEALRGLDEWVKSLGVSEDSVGVITCGNWDLKTQIPKHTNTQPSYLRRWINLKDIYNEFYKPKHPVTGMKGMLNRMKLPLNGVHHLGMDDVDNITAVAYNLLKDGAVLHITGSLRENRK